jgi:hypothetical protein
MGRRGEAVPLLEEAIPVLDALGAAPELQRARVLAADPDPAVAG